MAGFYLFTEHAAHTLYALPGHLWSTLFGLSGSPHSSAMHILSYLVIGGGFVLLSSAWPVLLAAQKHGRLATTGVCGRVRHPRYVGFVLIMFGFLLHWPTILTLIMFPFLVFMYVHLARTEAAEARRAFGDRHVRYAAAVPGWFPRLGGSAVNPTQV